MKVQGINKVLIAVRDIDKAMAIFSQLFGATFHDVKAEEEFGIRCVTSWDTGIEILSPLPRSHTAPSINEDLHQFLEKHGEGLYGVAFSGNVDEARVTAEEMSSSGNLLEFDQEHIKKHLGDKFKTVKEYVFNSKDTCGALVVVSQIEPK
jgi:methylmalonyl-CoA/ethylmalonyl-CoA epimerase